MTAVRTCALNRYNNDNFGMTDIYDLSYTILFIS